MTTDELRAKFEAFHGLSWDGIRTLLVNDGTKLRLRNVYQHDFEVWQAAHASRDAEVEALKRDAERYRWLSRKHANPVEKDWYVYGATGPFLSDSIDAAMREESK